MRTCFYCGQPTADPAAQYCARCGRPLQRQPGAPPPPPRRPLRPAETEAQRRQGYRALIDLFSGKVAACHLVATLAFLLLCLAMLLLQLPRHTMMTTSTIAYRQRLLLGGAAVLTPPLLGLCLRAWCWRSARRTRLGRGEFSRKGLHLYRMFCLVADVLVCVALGLGALTFLLPAQAVGQASLPGLALAAALVVAILLCIARQSSLAAIEQTAATGSPVPGVSWLWLVAMLFIQWLGVTIGLLPPLLMLMRVLAWSGWALLVGTTLLVLAAAMGTGANVLYRYRCLMGDIRDGYPYKE